MLYLLAVAMLSFVIGLTLATIEEFKITFIYSKSKAKTRVQRWNFRQRPSAPFWWMTAISAVACVVIFESL